MSPNLKALTLNPLNIISTMNTYTPTPETDGEWNRLASQDHPEFERNLADFARNLERERDELAERLDFQQKLNRECIDQITDRTNERDEIRAQLREEQQLHVQTLNERDQWRNEHDRVVHEYQHRMMVIGMSVIDATSYPENVDVEARCES